MNPAGNLAGVRAGVLRNSFADELVRREYPNAETVYFEGEAARIEAIAALTEGSIDTFIDDGILLAGEIQRQGRSPQDYAIVPDRPLSCQYYGLILPGDDAEWTDAVNDFIDRDRTRQIRRTWLSDFFPAAISTLNACLK